MRHSFAIPALAILASAALLLAQTATVKSGAYTAEQATAGEAAYAADCASCHGTDLEGKGRQMPPLKGEEFLNGWTGLSLGDLFDKMQETMPADKPGQLPKDRTASILAYVLKKNGFPAGAAKLPADAVAVGKIGWN